MKRLLIIGSGGHAGVVAEAAMLAGYSVLGFIDDVSEVGTIKHGYEVLGSIKQSVELYKSLGADCIHVAIGDEAWRRDIVRKLADLQVTEEPGFKMEMETIIHPRGYVSAMAKISYGSFVGINAVVEPNASVGRFCILRAGYIVRHDETINAFTTL